MDTQFSFDLNLAIQQWRKNLAQSPAFQNENLNELESHLRDSIALWQAKGLSAHEAFAIATQRIGAGPKLENEFAKVNSHSVWHERLLWMLIGVQIWTLVNGIAGFTTQNILLFGWNTPSPEQGVVFPISVVSALRLLLVIAAASASWWMLARKSGRFGQWLAARIQKRSFFWGGCIGAILVSITGQILFFCFQAYWLGHFGPETFGHRTMYLGFSQLFAHLVELIAMVVFILVLARKRLRTTLA